MEGRSRVQIPQQQEPPGVIPIQRKLRLHATTEACYHLDAYSARRLITHAISLTLRIHSCFALDS